MRIVRLSLFFSAIFFAGFGLWLLIDPTGTARLVEIVLPTPASRIDFRATYGGLNLALGALLAAAGSRPQQYGRAGLILQIAVFTGYLGGRLIGIAAESAIPPPMSTILAFEIPGLALGLIALSRTSASSHAATVRLAGR